MSDDTDSQPASRENYGKKGSRGPWAHLDKETRERYEAIQARVLEKWKRGELDIN